MRNVCANIAARPYLNFIRYEKEVLGRGLRLGDFVDRVTKNFLAGAQQPELAMAYLADTVVRYASKADSIIAAERSLGLFHKHTLTDRQYRESIVHDDDGDVTGMAHGMMRLQYQSTADVTLGAAGYKMALYAMPDFRTRARTPLEKTEQPLLASVTLGRAYPLLVPRATTYGHLDPNECSVTTLDIRDNDAKWHVKRLDWAIEKTNCGMWFIDKKSHKPSDWAEKWIKTDMKASEDVKRRVRENLEAMTDCDNPTEAQRKSVTPGRGRHHSYRVIDGWRNVHPLESRYRKLVGAGTVEMVVPCQYIGHIMEAFKPTAHILEEIQAFKRHHAGHPAKFNTEAGLLLGMSEADVALMIGAPGPLVDMAGIPGPGDAYNFRGAAVDGTDDDRKRIQILRLANRARLNIRDVAAIAPTPTPAAPIAAGQPGAPPVLGSPVPRFQTQPLNVLLGKLPKASFDAVMKLAPQLDELAEPSSATAPHVNRVLSVLLERIETHYKSLDKGRVDYVMDGLLALLPKDLTKIDAKVVKDVETTFSGAQGLAVATNVVATRALGWSEAETWRAHLAAAPAAGLSGASLGARVSGSVGAAHGGDVPHAFFEAGISPSRISALIAATNGLPADEMFLLFKILTTECNVPNLTRLAHFGFPMIGGRFESHSMRFITTSVIIMRGGGTTVRTHISPALVDYGSYAEQQRTSLTAAFHQGNEWVDWQGIASLECFFPHRTMGGMRDHLLLNIADIHALFHQSAPWAEGNNTQPSDMIFLPRPATENDDDWPQYAFTDSPPPVDMMGVRDVEFMRVSTCHAVLRAMLGGMDRANAIHQTMMQRLHDRKHLDCVVAPCIHRAATYYYNRNNTVGSRWCLPNEGTGPLGPMYMNHAPSVAHVFNAKPGMSFPAPHDLPPFINV